MPNRQVFVRGPGLRGPIGPQGEKGDPGDPGGPPGPAGPAGRTDMLADLLAGAPLDVWDDFNRSDRYLVGDTSPSGHVYSNSGDASKLTIVDGRFLSDVAAGGAQILYARTGRPLRGIAAEFVFRDDSGVVTGNTGAQNAVIGCAAVGFGSGSIQLAIYPGAPGDPSTWKLFSVPNPIFDPYPTLAEGDLVEKMLEDGETRYRVALIRTGVSTVRCLLPDGQIVEFDDADAPVDADPLPPIASYWGNRVGWQLRRPDGSGTVEFLSIGTSAEPHASRPITGDPVFPGVVDNFASCPNPGYVAGDLDVVVYGSGSWSHSGTMIGQDGPDTRRGWRFRNSARRPSLTVSLDGVNIASIIADANVPFKDGQGGWLRATRDAATGVTKFYTSTEVRSTPIASVTWTQLGTDQSSTAGAPFDSFAGFNIGQAWNSDPFTGKVSVAQVRDGIGGSAVATWDTRTPWSGIDAQGNTWTLSGAMVEWAPDLPAPIGIMSRMRLYGDAGTYFSTPKPTNATTVWTLNDLDVAFLGVPERLWRPTTDSTMVQQYGNAGNRAYRFRILTTGYLRWEWYIDGSTPITVDSTVVVPANTQGVRATFSHGNGRVTFYTTTDATTDAESAGITWTQLGSFVTSTVSSPYNSTADVEVAPGWLGTIRYAEVSSLVDDDRFRAALDLRHPWTTPDVRQYIDARSNTWTVKGTGYRWQTDPASAPITSLIGLKRSDQAVTSSTTLVAVDDLTADLEANAVYQFEAFLIYSASTTGDMKIAVTGPSGHTVDWTIEGASTGAVSNSQSGSYTYRYDNESSASRDVGGADVGVKLVARVRGFMTTGSTAGQLGLKFAQATSDAGATTIFTRSRLVARRV